MALTGYISYKFGFHLSRDIKELQGEEPTNEMLKESVKYYAEKAKNKKSK